jgi:hypothetical protein
VGFQRRADSDIFQSKITLVPKKVHKKARIFAIFDVIVINHVNRYQNCIIFAYRNQ